MKSVLHGLFTLLRTLLVLLWRGLEATRRLAFNLLFLILLAGVLTYALLHRTPSLQPNTALVLDLGGNLVEQHAASADRVLLSQIANNPQQQADIQLRDVLQVLQAAGQDAHITRVIVQLDDLRVTGLPILHEVAAALDRFRAHHKRVIAWSSHYDQRQYYLAVHADEIDLDPMGEVALEGFGHYRNYYREALDKLGVTVHLMRVGTYKSFGEPFIANEPSPAAQEADHTLLDALWQNYTQAVEQARHLTPGCLNEEIAHLPQLLEKAGGDEARLALEQHWVDALKTAEDLRLAQIREGAADAEGHDFRQISFDDYLAQLKPDTHGQSIALVVAEGEVHDGEAAAGTIGGLSTAELIRSAREDRQVKALVLRIDSPGGSAYGSELIRRELELTRAAGKPVVVSMGNLAASGGYWMALGADELIADPATVTGSIGVFALVPTADKLMGKLGIHPGGVTTTWLSDAANPLRPLDPRLQSLIQSNVNHIYTEFTHKTALARKQPQEQIEAVAQGRVWTGAQALQRHLVDRLGSLQEAIEAAAHRAHLGSAYHVDYRDPPSRGLEHWLALLQNTRVLQVLLAEVSRWQALAGTPGSGQSALAAFHALDLRATPGALLPLEGGPSLEHWHPDNLVLAHCLCVSP